MMGASCNLLDRRRCLPFSVLRGRWGTQTLGRGPGAAGAVRGGGAVLQSQSGDAGGGRSGSSGRRSCSAMAANPRRRRCPRMAGEIARWTIWLRIRGSTRWLRRRWATWLSALRLQLSARGSRSRWRIRKPWSWRAPNWLPVSPRSVGWTSCRWIANLTLSGSALEANPGGNRANPDSPAPGCPS